MSALSEVVRGMEEEIARLKADAKIDKVCQETIAEELGKEIKRLDQACKCFQFEHGDLINQIRVLRETLARCSKICSQTGLEPPNGQWARMQVIATVEEALKEGV